MIIFAAIHAEATQRTDATPSNRGSAIKKRFSPWGEWKFHCLGKNEKKKIGRLNLKKENVDKNFQIEKNSK